MQYMINPPSFQQQLMYCRTQYSSFIIWMSLCTIISTKLHFFSHTVHIDFNSITCNYMADKVLQYFLAHLLGNYVTIKMSVSPSIFSHNKCLYVCLSSLKVTENGAKFSSLHTSSRHNI